MCIEALLIRNKKIFVWSQRTKSSQFHLRTVFTLPWLFITIVTLTLSGVCLADNREWLFSGTDILYSLLLLQWLHARRCRHLLTAVLTLKRTTMALSSPTTATMATTWLDLLRLTAQRMAHGLLWRPHVSVSPLIKSHMKADAFYCFFHSWTWWFCLRT